MKSKLAPLMLTTALGLAAASSERRGDDSSLRLVPQRQLHRVTCLTQDECQARSREVGAASFHVGDFPHKGCVAKNGKVYFSPGTEAEMSTEELSGTRVRLWCEGNDELSEAGAEEGPSNATSITSPPTSPPTSAPSPGPTSSPTSSPATSNPTKSPSSAPTTTMEPTANGTVDILDTSLACLTREECYGRSQELGLAFYVSKFQTKGCFMKNGKVFFARGTVEQMSTQSLPGIQERLWCDGGMASNETGLEDTTSGFGGVNDPAFQAALENLTAAIVAEQNQASNTTEASTTSPTTTSPTKSPTSNMQGSPAAAADPSRGVAGGEDGANSARALLSVSFAGGVMAALASSLMHL